jgi:hypothetical protein
MEEGWKVWGVLWEVAGVRKSWRDRLVDVGWRWRGRGFGVASWEGGRDVTATGLRGK